MTDQFWDKIKWYWFKDRTWIIRGSSRIFYDCIPNSIKESNKEAKRKWKKVWWFLALEVYNLKSLCFASRFFLVCLYICWLRFSKKIFQHFHLSIIYIIVLIFRVGLGCCYPWGRWIGSWYVLRGGRPPVCTPPHFFPLKSNMMVVGMPLEGNGVEGWVPPLLGYNPFQFFDFCFFKDRWVVFFFVGLGGKEFCFYSKTVLLV